MKRLNLSVVDAVPPKVTVADQRPGFRVVAMFDRWRVYRPQIWRKYAKTAPVAAFVRLTMSRAQTYHLFVKGPTR